MNGFLKLMQTLCQTINSFQENANYKRKSKTFLCINSTVQVKNSNCVWMQIKKKNEKFPSELHQTMYIFQYELFIFILVDNAKQCYEFTEYYASGVLKQKQFTT